MCQLGTCWRWECRLQTYVAQLLFLTCKAAGTVLYVFVGI